MDITKQTIVADLITVEPAAVAILARHGVDACDEGPNTLEAAARRARADLARLVADLQRDAPRPAAPTREVDASLPDLVRHLLDERHPVLRRRLHEAAALVERVVGHHAADQGQVLRPLAATFEGLTALVYAHLDRQRDQLLPLLREGTSAGMAEAAAAVSVLHVLSAEQAGIEGGLETMREITRGYTPPPGACAIWRALHGGLAALEWEVRALIDLERHALFPRAAAAVRDRVPV